MTMWMLAIYAETASLIMFFLDENSVTTATLKEEMDAVKHAR